MTDACVNFLIVLRKGRLLLCLQAGKFSSQQSERWEPLASTPIPLIFDPFVLPDILETAMRDIYVQTLEERSHNSKANDLPLASIRYIRPEQALMSDLNAFGEQSSIDAMFALGEKAATSGFMPYAWKTFHL